MVKKHFVFLFLVIICISFVFAASTKIEVKTLPNDDVYLSILNYADPNYAWQIIKNTSDQYGDASFVYTSDTVSKFDLRVVIKEGEERIHTEEFQKDYPAGTPIYLKAAPEGTKLIETPSLNETNISSENQTLENQTVLIEENESTKSGLSGGVIAEKIKNIFSGRIIYYILGIVVIGLFVLVLRRRPEKLLREIRIRKLSELTNERKERGESNAEILAAEKRLKEAKREVNRLKNSNKIQELEDKLKEQQDELRRLKEGGD